MKHIRPDEATFAPYYARYIAQVPDGNIVDTLASQGPVFSKMIRELDEEGLNYSYAPGKWSAKEVIIHVIDAERIFDMRAVAFSRGETQPLPGFDQDMYIHNLDSSHRTAEDLAEEFDSVRASTITLFRSMTPAQWKARGIASNGPMAVDALAWIIAGHLEHHRRILQERYKHR